MELRYIQISKKLKFRNWLKKILIWRKRIKIIVEGFDPAINYGPNDAGISALTIVLGILGLIAISWLFGKIYAQLAKLFEANKKNKS